MPHSRTAGGRAVPETTRWTVRARLERHAKEEWDGRCRAIDVRFRGRFAYVDALPVLDGGPDEAPIHLCRLRYLGQADRWEFAFYTYSGARYEPSCLPSGSFVGSPEEAFDCAALTYLG
jgi:hypothetical protein